MKQGVGPNQLPPRPCLPGGTASADPDCFHWNATRRMRAARNWVNERPPGMGAPRKGLLEFFIARLKGWEKAVGAALFKRVARPSSG